MFSKTKLCLLVFFTFSLFVACLSKEERDPDEDLHRCQVRCARPLQPFRKQAACEQKCLEQYKGWREPEEEREDRPRRQLEKCQRQCAEHESHQERCQSECQIEYEREREREEQRGGGGGGSVESNHHQKGEKEKREENPYYFEGQRFESMFRTDQGHFRVLERFSERSELLRGIENYRVAVLEANPKTFMVPHHCDAEAVFSVVRGQGTISFIRENKRESYNLQRGDIIKVPAGSVIYLINQDDNEKLQILLLVHPINTPGRFEEYFGVGGENPESFYKVFSNDILEAALNTRRDKLDRLFGQQKKGVFVKASDEQIRALSQESAGGASRERGESSKGPFNLLKQRPQFSTSYGNFYEASPDNIEQLRNIDASVAFMNIKQGGMIVPYYNSKSTKLVFVARGNGYFEMACPHLARQSKGSHGRRQEEQEGKGVHYQKVTARLSVGDVFIIPAGHPITIVASQNEDLQLVGFGVNARNDQKNFLAGRDNIWGQVEQQAKELSFQVPSREVDEIFKSQEESHFVAGPQRREKGMDHYVASVLDFAGFL